MIYTSSYQQIESNKYKTISISWDRGKDANYIGDNISVLAPKLSFWRTWKNNKSILSEMENNKYYIEEYYKQVLSVLDPCDIYNLLNNKIMLCYEDNSQFCHRHIVSAWLELFLDINVFEVVENNERLIVVDRPLYIKNMLEDTIKYNMDMNGFKSIRAAYLFNQSKKISDSVISEHLLYEANSFEECTDSLIKVYKK